MVQSLFKFFINQNKPGDQIEYETLCFENFYYDNALPGESKEKLNIFNVRPHDVCSMNISNFMKHNLVKVLDEKRGSEFKISSSFIDLRMVNYQRKMKIYLSKDSKKDKFHSIND